VLAEGPGRRGPLLSPPMKGWMPLGSCGHYSVSPRGSTARAPCTPHPPHHLFSLFRHIFVPLSLTVLPVVADIDLPCATMCVAPVPFYFSLFISIFPPSPMPLGHRSTVPYLPAPFLFFFCRWTLSSFPFSLGVWYFHRFYYPLVVLVPGSRTKIRNQLESLHAPRFTAPFFFLPSPSVGIFFPCPFPLVVGPHSVETRKRPGFGGPPTHRCLFFFFFFLFFSPSSLYFFVFLSFVRRICSASSWRRGFVSANFEASCSCALSLLFSSPFTPSCLFPSPPFFSRAFRFFCLPVVRFV